LRFETAETFRCCRSIDACSSAGRFTVILLSRKLRKFSLALGLVRLGRLELTAKRIFETVLWRVSAVFSRKLRSSTSKSRQVLRALRSACRTEFSLSSFIRKSSASMELFSNYSL